MKHFHRKAPPLSVIIGGVIVVLSLGTVFSVVSTLTTVYNVIVQSKNGAEQALNNLETFYQRRYALVENLVAIVKETKGFETYQITIEKELLPRVAEAKAQATTLTLKHPTESEQRLARETALHNVLLQSLDKLLVLAQNYPTITDPTLKDRQATFIALQELKKSLQNLEDDIQTGRQTFNGAIRSYNQNIQLFPANFLAPGWGFTPLKGFEVLAPEARRDAKIVF